MQFAHVAQWRWQEHNIIWCSTNNRRQRAMVGICWHLVRLSAEPRPVINSELPTYYYLGPLRQCRNLCEYINILKLEYV